MKFLTLILVLLSSVSSLANAKDCSNTLTSTNPTLDAALKNLYSFEYVLHAITQKSDEMEQVQYCVSGLPLSQNNYLYKKFFIQIEVSDVLNPTESHTFSFLYQDASIQAYHNVGSKPWVGVSTGSVQEMFSKWLERKEFQVVSTASVKSDPLTIAKNTQVFTQYEDDIDVKTIAIFPLKTKNAKFSEIYLVSFMTKSKGNPYTYPVLTKGVLVAKTATQVYVAENISLFSDVLNPIEQLLIGAQKQQIAGESFEELLLRLE